MTLQQSFHKPQRNSSEQYGALQYNSIVQDAACQPGIQCPTDTLTCGGAAGLHTIKSISNGAAMNCLGAYIQLL